MKTTMKITDAPGEIDVEDMLQIFLRILDDTNWLDHEERTYIRNQDRSFDCFCDPVVQTMWIGFALGHRSRDRLASIPKSRTHDPEGYPTLFQIGLFITSLSKTLEAAGVSRHSWEQWRIDGRIIMTAYWQILAARQVLLDSFAAAGELRLPYGSVALLDALRQLGTAVDLPEIDEPAG